MKREAVPKEESFQVLFIESNPENIQLFSGLFAVALPKNFHLNHIETLAAAKQILSQKTFHVILLNLSLPDSQGMDTLKSLLSSVGSLPPVIVLVKTEEELLAIQAIQEGAEDYLVREQANAQVLKLSVRHAIHRHRMTAELTALRWREHFLAFASHELRSPLTAIQAFSSLLLHTKPEKTKEVLPEYVSNISSQVKRMSRMLDNFLDIAKIESGHPITLMPEIFDVRELVEGIVKTQKILNPYRRFNIIYNPKVKILHADRDKILQVLVNLLSNADKYSSKDSPIDIRVFPEGPNLRFEITNQGVGIAPKMMGKIFAPYYRMEAPEARKTKGTGIGLFLCKYLVEAHGGKIGVKSKPNEKTTFFFTLPV